MRRAINSKPERDVTRPVLERPAAAPAVEGRHQLPRHASKKGDRNERIQPRALDHRGSTREGPCHGGAAAAGCYPANS